MMTPSEMSFSFLIGSLLFEAVKVWFGGELDVKDFAHDAYWFCGAMALVHFGIVTPPKKRAKND